MAARRLLIILVLLLAASVVAAALAPDRTDRLTSDESTTTTTTTTTDSKVERKGESLSVRIDASAEKPETVEGFVGDQLSLSVSVGSAQAGTIELEPLGLAEFAGPDAPAHFDLLLRDPGAVPITDSDGEVVGRLLISEPGDPVDPELQGPAGGGEGKAEKAKGRGSESPGEGRPRGS